MKSSHSFSLLGDTLRLWGCLAHISCVHSRLALTSLFLSASWMEARWETFTSKSASPGSSPCWMLPPANLCGLHWVNTALWLLVLDTQTLFVCTAWTNLHKCLHSFTAVQNSTKGSYRDKRNQVVYSEDFLWLGKKKSLFFHVAFHAFALMITCSWAALSVCLQDK